MLFVRPQKLLGRRLGCKVSDFDTTDFIFMCHLLTDMVELPHTVSTDWRDDVLDMYLHQASQESLSHHQSRCFILTLKVIFP